jgi:hypothetical protein
MQNQQRIILAVLVAVAFCPSAFCGQFVVFPKASVLQSPDGRFEVRNDVVHHSPSEFSGMFNSLWLVEIATGGSRKLYDYVGVAAVAWSGNEFLAITEYVGKRTSRAVVFRLAHPDDAVVLDEPGLALMVPSELRPTLRENDHVFVEASRIEEGKLYLRVWGYGSHDTNGFHWRCEYALEDGKIFCTVDRVSH